MPKDKRTKKERAAAVGIGYRRWHQLATEDGGFAILIANRDTTDEDIMNYIQERKSQYTQIGKEEVMNRRREADMKLAEEKAALATIERRKAERELVEADEIRRVTGRAMQALSNSVLGMPAKVRAMLCEYIAPAEATAIEEKVYELVRGECDKCATTLSELG